MGIPIFFGHGLNGRCPGILDERRAEQMHVRDIENRGLKPGAVADLRKWVTPSPILPFFSKKHGS